MQWRSADAALACMSAALREGHIWSQVSGDHNHTSHAQPSHAHTNVDANAGDVHIPVRVADGFEDYDDLPPAVDFYNVGSDEEEHQSQPAGQGAHTQSLPSHSRAHAPVDDTYAATVAAARAAQESVRASPSATPGPRHSSAPGTVQRPSNGRSLPTSAPVSAATSKAASASSERAIATPQNPAYSAPSTPYVEPISSRPRPKERALDLVSAWAVPCFRKRQNSLAVRLELTDYGDGGSEQAFAVIVTLTGFPKHEVVRTYAQFEDLSNEVAMGAFAVKLPNRRLSIHPSHQPRHVTLPPRSLHHPDHHDHPSILALPDLSDDAPLFPVAPKKSSKLFKNTIGSLCGPCLSCGNNQRAACCAQLDLYLQVNHREESERG